MELGSPFPFLDAILAATFLAAGLLSLLAAVFNWNWFFDTASARSVAGGKRSRQRARLLYGFFGVALIAASFMLASPLL